MSVRSAASPGEVIAGEAVPGEAVPPPGRAHPPRGHIQGKPSLTTATSATPR